VTNRFVVMMLMMLLPQDIPAAFASMSKDDLKSYILMEKICAPPQQSTVIMKGKPQTVSTGE
jgi:hypothetical protein